MRKALLTLCTIMLPMIVLAQWGEINIPKAKKSHSSGKLEISEQKIEFPLAKESQYRTHILKNLVNNMVCVNGGGLKVNDSTQIGISTFYIGKYEVTQEEWWAVMGNNPSSYHADKSYPITDVNWYDCQEFIQELNRLTGLYFRMPTVDEWLFASNGGNYSRGYRYAGSNMVESVAWFSENSGGKVQRVGEKQPNELGLFDMSGNVCEWVYGNLEWSSHNPTGPISGTYKRVMGGCMQSESYDCCVDYQHLLLSYCTPKSSWGFIGLRLAMSEKPERILFDIADFKTKNEIRKYPISMKSPKTEVFDSQGFLDYSEEMPSFPGGASSLHEYLSKSIKYPIAAEENGIQGRVVVQFVVEKDGSIPYIRVVRSVDPSLDKEAIRVAMSMPRWIPGKQNGVPVRVKFTLPISFRLQ